MDINHAYCEFISKTHMHGFANFQTPKGPVDVWYIAPLPEGKVDLQHDNLGPKLNEEARYFYSKERGRKEWDRVRTGKVGPSVVGVSKTDLVKYLNSSN